MNNTLEMFLDFYPISKQDKVKVYPRVETQVNSAHGHINVTLVIMICNINDIKSGLLEIEISLSFFITFFVLGKNQNLGSWMILVDCMCLYLEKMLPRHHSKGLEICIKSISCLFKREQRSEGKL